MVHEAVLLLGARFAAAGHPMVTTVLACVAAVVWLVLTYGVPASLLLARQRDSVLSGIDGTWLLWVVATQSLSIDASTLFPAWPSQSELLATAAVALWSVGLVLYLLLTALIWQRWLTVVISGHPKPALLDLDGCHRDHRAGRGRHPDASRHPACHQRGRRLCQGNLLRMRIPRLSRAGQTAS